MDKRINYSTNLKFYPNINDILPDFNVPKLNDYTDKVVLPPFILNEIISQQTATGCEFPSPLIFKVSTGDDKSCFVGVREFSSVDEYIILPNTIQEKLGVSLATEEISINLELATNIPKGTSLVLKPLDLNYGISNWKFFLEAKLTIEYTTLTQDDILYIEDNGKVYKLLIDTLEPASTISIVDTEIELSIEPLNDEHAKSIQENNLNNNNEIIELVEPLKILSLEPQSEDYKIKVPVNKHGDLVIQLLIKDQEFDNHFIDIFASNDIFVDKQGFKWSTLDNSKTVRREGIVQLVINCNEFQDVEYIYMVPFLWTTKTIFTVQVGEKINGIQEEEEIIDDQVESFCSNCHAKVSKQTLFLHENFCLRNNVRCDKGCGKIFHKRIPETHWHCPNCNEFGDSPELLQHHNDIYHTEYGCKDCGANFKNFIDCSNHRANECDFKLHECRFCHLIVPRGKTTLMDSFNQLSNHESGCSSKTIDCDKCGKPVKLINYESHMKLHELNRISKPEPVKCANVNCVKTGKLNDFQLCDICFGPSFSNVYDVDNSKLQSRFERRYVIQLSRGCGTSWCKNANCKSSGLSKFSSMADIINHVKNDLLVKIPNLPCTKNLKLESPSYYFCVDGSTTKKKLLLEWIFEEGQFSFNWCCEAVNHYTEEQAAKKWLQENGVAINE